MDVPVVARTAVGHVRRRNEDHAVVGTVRLTGPASDHAGRLSTPTVVAVLDGMGGHPAGDVASRLAAEGLGDAGVPNDADDVAAILATLQSRLANHMQDHPESTAMGTTLVGAAVHDDGSALVFGVGDSTARWWRNHQAGDLLPLDRGPFGGITQVLGGSAQTESLRPHVQAVTGPGRLLLCSDGLSDVVEPDVVATTLGEPDPEAAARSLVDLALDRGGPDNVTVVLVDLVAPQG